MRRKRKPYPTSSAHALLSLSNASFISESTSLKIPVNLLKKTSDVYFAL